MSNACIGTLRSFSTLPLGRSISSSSALRIPYFWRPPPATKGLVRQLWGAASLHGAAKSWRDRAGGDSPLDTLRPCGPQSSSRCFSTPTPLSNPLPPRRSSKPTHSPTTKPRNPTPAASPASLSFDNLTRSDLRSIFNAEVAPADGAHILQTLQTRRIDGSLIDHGVQIADSQVPHEANLRALKWLRQKHPLDEQTAATAYSAREAEKVSNSYIARAERLGIYKAPEGASAASTGAGEYSGVNTDRSVLEDFKLYHEERRRREHEEKERSGENKRNQEMRIAKLEERQAAKELRAQKLEEYRQEMIEKSYASPFKEIPEMTKRARLLPSTLFGIATTLALIASSYYYTPPLRSSRLFPELPMSVATWLGIGITCLLVTILWHVPPLWKIFNRYFVVSTAWPYMASLIGNVFSHQTFRHLGSNLFGALVFAVPLHEEIGRGNFLALWVDSGVLGALISMYYYTFTNRLGFYHFGCSGAVWGVMMSWIYFDQRKTHDPDDPNQYLRVARYAFALILALGNLGTGILSRTDVFAHGGGGVVGFCWAYVLAWRADNRKRLAGQVEEDKSFAQEQRHMANEARVEQSVARDERR
ncbi:MAG: hypothetical protein M1828_006459 [Chrysothrix sp. TS-e1954]|nr:MAG: hypothetical protein M1828_006459 [Chrysothrix sp. TS-e1954]